MLVIPALGRQSQTDFGGSASSLFGGGSGTLRPVSKQKQSRSLPRKDHRRLTADLHPVHTRMRTQAGVQVHTHGSANTHRGNTLFLGDNMGPSSFWTPGCFTAVVGSAESHMSPPETGVEPSRKILIASYACPQSLGTQRSPGRLGSPALTPRLPRPSPMQEGEGRGEGGGATSQLSPS